MIETICKKCGNKKSFGEDKFGKKFRCPNCGNVVLIEEATHKDTPVKLTSLSAELGKGQLPQFSQQTTTHFPWKQVVIVSFFILLVASLLVYFLGPKLQKSTASQSNIENQAPVAVSSNSIPPGSAGENSVDIEKINTANSNLTNATATTKTYLGNIGKLSASFNLTWYSDGKIEGKYYYPRRPNIIYTIKGKELKIGIIQLTEYTGNIITANCDLSKQEDCFVGKMVNTDGRVLKMKICLDENEISAGDLSSNIPGKFPFATTRLLNESELSVFSQQDLKIMRNEIFARHGYIFKTSDMKSYFASQPWYHAQFDDVAAFLSLIEQQNVALIKKHE